MNFNLIASICITVQSTRIPGDGCCSDLTSFSSNVSTTPPGQIPGVPEGARCDLEWIGTEVASTSQFKVDGSVNCALQDGMANYRTVKILNKNGSPNFFAVITTHPNGTVEAKCDFSLTQAVLKHTVLSQTVHEQQCWGPKYEVHQTFVGGVTYGSKLKAERFITDGVESDEVHATDVDVENGCVPIRQAIHYKGVVDGVITWTNHDFSEPAESQFEIPQECLKQSVTADVLV